MPRQATALAALALQHKRRVLPGLLVLLAGLAALLYMKYAMAATFTVTSTADTGGSTCGGTCTLRQAINAANAAGVGPHTINFNIPGCSTGCTITVGTGNDLPALTRPVNINGASQPGYSGTPLVRVHGDRYWALFWFEVATGLQLSAGSSGSTIRGLALTNFQSDAIVVNSSNNTIAGNYIGTDITGNTVVANNTGVWLQSGTGNTVGGTTAADRNVISGNMASGVYITSSSNVVVGNYIGVGANGSTALGNDNAGVWLTWVANNNRIGGVNAADANIIANNTLDGITLQGGGSSSGNSFLRNAIYNNGTRGIDLNDDAVTLNDAGDGDSGPNGLQNFPVVTTAATNGASTTVTGSLNSNANTTYRIEFFSNATGDSSGYGEGQVYLGTTTVTTNGSGNATYSQALGVGTTVGHKVTATATVDLGGGNYGSSSEYALNATVTLTPAGVTASAISGDTTEAGGTATFTVVLNRAPTANVTIPVSSSNTTEGTVSTSSLVFTTANWSTPQTVTVTGQDDTLVDGDRAYTIVLGAATSADSAYNGLNPADVAVVNTDNDTQSTIVVTTASDVIDGTTTSLYALLTNKGADGQISLREAITAANNSANGSGGPDIINFAVGTGSFSISLGSSLPALSQPTIINGWSQPGYTSTPLVIIDCNQLGVYGLQLGAGAGGSTVRGMVIRDCSIHGIRIDSGSNGNTIVGNYLGSYGAAGTDQGVGEQNIFNGIYIEGANNIIGGSTAAERNVIGGNQNSGIRITTAAATGNRVQGNYIGINAAGTAAVANGTNGVMVDTLAANNIIGTNLDGSNDATEGNVIAGNSGVGIYVGGNGTIVRGNYVGLLPDGATKLANGSYGIDVIPNITSVTIGGTATGAGNVVSGNGNAGILFETGSSGTVKGNLVGTDATGNTVITGTGAALFIASANVQVGGTTTAEGNTFAGSNTDGIIVSGVTATGNAILGNRIHSNSSLGIDLADNGVTANDSGDADTGPNNLQNFPVLTAALTNVGNTQVTITGSLNSVASTNFRIEFFASTTADPSGYGEGQRYLGSANVTTDASGNATISTVLTASVAVSETISSTATRANAGYTAFTDTSEFSANVVAALPPYTITGTVYEDVNYGGGAGRTLAASSGAGVSGATVELYSPDTGLVATTTTNGSGAYTFNVSNGGYFVRVVQSTVSSTRSGSTAALRAVQTWRQEASWLTPAAVTNEVGGARPDTADSSAAAALSWTACAAENATCTFTGTRLVRYGVSPNFTTRVATSSVACNNATFGDPAVSFGKACAVLQPNLHSASSVHIAGASTSGVNFGFNFSTVTNVNDSGTGSLRQAITNANALADTGLAQSGRTAGIESLVFMISNGTTGSGGSLSLSGGLRATENLFSGGVATITPTSALPTLSTPMVVDAQAQPGWASSPLVHINGASAGGGNGLTVTGGSTVLRGLAVRGYVGAWGIYINGSSANTIEGCWVGLNAAGTAAAANGQGVWIDSSANNVVGGTTSTKRNVLSGNTFNGLVLNSATGTVIKGNYLGLNAAGTAAVANGDGGIVLIGNSTGSTIGGTTAGEGNFIAGNTAASGLPSAGISIQASGSTGSVITGNVFGMKADLSATVPTQGSGIYVKAANTTIGGTAAGAGNIITAHSGDGISVTGTTTSAVTIQGNSIYGNTGIGIDLADDGATANDGAKTASQPNLLMDAPVFTTATISGTTLTVAGYVGSAASQSTFATSRVEVFVSDNSSASGQGQTYLGFLTTDASGNFSGTLTGVTGVVSGTTRLTGTATDASGNTSEFGANFTVGWTISGTVFEDVNYGGGAGRSQATAAGVGLVGATVELYSSAGVWVRSTTTTTGGAYSFSGLASATYHVRVVGSTVQSQRTGSTGALVGVMTYRTTAATGTAVAVTDQVGGTTPSLVDAAAGSAGATFNTTTGVFSAVVTGTAQSYAPVALGTSTISGVDFGFNFSAVVNINDAGQGSLRQAITNANALSNTGLAQSGRTAGIENLVFMISNGTAAAGLRSANNYFSGGVATIAPTSALPTVTDPLVMDAQTQPGWVLAPVVELNGTGAGAVVNGLTLNAAGSVLRGFIVNRFTNEGVTTTSGAGLVIQGNYIGTNAAGTAASPNNKSGIWINQSAGGHQIGGTTASQRNVISSQTNFQGLAILGGSGHVVQGNYIGTSADGTAALGNTSDGILIYGGVSNSTIGGTVAGAGNLVRSNGGRGVSLLVGATGVAIQGNSIFGNTGPGIDLNANGITANDGAKTAGQANLLMDSPVFTSATISGTTLTVAGYVGSAANQSTFASARVEVFISDNSFANGQGQTYLGFLTTDANGNFSGTITGAAGITAASTKVTGTATDGSGNTSEFGANVTVTLAITGTVFEDVNYGGGAGRTLAASAGVGLTGATVELYSSAGVWVRSTTSTSGGAYSFTGLAAGTYHVRVVNSTVPSQRSGSTGALVGVMTYRTTATTGTAVAVTDQVGGTTPSLADAAAGSAGATFNTTTGVFSAVVSGTAQSYAAVTLGSSSISGVDFGFNFSTVVNTNNAGQGSLRQFLTNANAFTDQASLAQSGLRSAVGGGTEALPAGTETSIFMIPSGSAVAGLRASVASALTGGVAVITPASQLPTIARSRVAVDGTTQTVNVGNTNAALLGTGGTVGTQAVALAQVPGPEVQISGVSSINRGLDVTGSNVQLRGLSVWGFGAGPSNTSGAVFWSTGSSATLELCALGITASSAADPRSSGVNQYANSAYITGVAGSTIRNNFIGFGYRGLILESSTGTHTVTANEIAGPTGHTLFEIWATNAVTATGNLIRNQGSAGSKLAVQIGAGVSSGTLQNNTVRDNAGTGFYVGASTPATSAVTLSNNVVTGNADVGVLVLTGTTRIQLSQNSIYGNTGLGVDLSTSSTAGDGITANDGAKTNGQANLLMDAPVFTTATLSGTTLTVAGYVGSAASQSTFAAARVEVFVSDASFANGQGQTYLGFLTADASGNFSGSITGVTGVVSGTTRITGTATDASGNTSEFGANATVGWAISGTVFEDVNYGGGAGRSQATAAGVGLVGATVELYTSAGVWVRSTTTTSGGAYSFGGLGSATYHVRVVGSTVQSQRTGSTGALVGVMTYRTTATTGTAVAVTDQVGGTTPSLADAAAGSTGATFNTTTGVFSAVVSGTAQSYAPVALGTSTISGVDFGFNFNTVVNTNNSGTGSLRQAMTNANAFTDDATLAVSGRTAGLEHIIFMLADGTTRAGLRNTFASQFAAGVATITPTSALPTISASLVLDAQTQPGWVQDPIIELRGNAAGAVAGLTLSGGAVTVRGLIINRYGSHGISITGGTSPTVQGCWLGTDATGAAAAANTGAGLSVSSSPSSLQIGGTTAAQRNVISGNTSHGVSVGGGTSVVLQGNYIGTSALGTVALANGGRGVWLDTSVTAATVGGTAAGAGNTIAASVDHGLYLGGGATTVQGNLIGTNAAGTAAMGNINGIYAATSGHQIGGTTTAARNVVSGNTSRGIWLNTGGNTVQGNYVGTNAAGTAALPNADGIYSKGVNNVIGGSATGAGNLVSGNTTTGVLLNSLADGTTVKGNTIGLNAALGAALANGIGVDVSCSTGCAIGGTATGEGNVISGNTGAGVRVNAASQGNAILSNRIDNNGGLGIDLNGNGVSVNDGAKTAGAGNLLMDQPVFTSARARGNQLTVAGYVGSAAGQATFANARVEIFSSSQDATGYGEGSTYLGSVTTDASGNFSGTITMTASVLAVGTQLTGTATDTSNNTSEFGANFSSLVVDLVVNNNGDGVDANPGDGICQTATAGQCTLRAALQEVNALAAQPSAVTIVFALPGCSAAGQAACTITPASALPAATRAVVVDAQTQPGWTVTPIVELLGSSAGASSYGLSLTVASSAVRGLVIGGFSQAGIAVSANNATIQGNVIGLQPGGTATRANGAAASVHGGIRVISGTGTLIGGTTAAQRNVMSGNAGAGLYVDAGTVTVTGNYIGTNAAGTAALGNGRSGIYLAGGSGHQIGGTTTGQGNVVSGNVGSQNSGIYVASSTTTIQGNLVGLNAAGSGFIANGDGVSTGAAGIDLRSGSGHVVGGSAAGEANVIAGNQGHGIRVTSQTSRISANSIYSNLWRGIDLNADGVTANDGAVSGAQPNNGMDHAVVTGAGIDVAGTGITVFGYIGTGTGQAVFAGARVEIFKANNDGSGYGQGATYLGYLTADASGRFSGTLSITLGAAVVGDGITATATDTSGNTSEFGPNWTSTTGASLSPAGFNAFETDTAAGSLTGVIRSKVAGTAATLAVLALDSAGTAPHAAFTGVVQLNWLDARDDTGAYTGSCRATWLDLGAAGTATFTLNNRVDVSMTPPATSTKVMRLKMTYAGPSGTVTACSNDAFAALPAQIAWIGASDATSATAGTTRTLNNVSASGGVVHQAGRPFTLRAQALTSTGALMTAYDGSPALAITSCVLPAGCTAGTLGGGGVAASGGLYTHSTVTYSEVGAVALQLTDTSYGNVDAADTTAGVRTFTSSSLQVGRFVPDSYAVSISTSGVLATANTACMASGSGATFLGQGFGWATAPQVTLTARNAAGATTALWTGSLMKLAPGAGLVPALSVSSAGSATLAASYGATAVQDLGAGQARLQASALDRFVLDSASAQDSTTPAWQWQLAVTDSSEAGTAGNPQPTATATQGSVSFDQGGSFHSARLTLASAHGDSRSGVRMLMELQRYTSAGWVTMTEDRGCVTVQRSQLEVSTPSGVFVSAGLCAAPLSASATTAGGRAWLSMPATPSADVGRLALRVAGTAASGSACSPAGAVQAVTTLGQPWLTGGSGGAGPQAMATWGRPQRDLVLRREIW